MANLRRLEEEMSLLSLLFRELMRVGHFFFLLVIFSSDVTELYKEYWIIKKSGSLQITQIMNSRKSHHYSSLIAYVSYELKLHLLILI